MAAQRIVVGLSGGVDSAVAAWLLKRAGHEVVAVFMKNWEDDDDSEYCASNLDFVDAAAVADVLGIELEHVNFAAEYKDRVFAEFLREYRAGRTPNPDVLCNAEIKFKAFLDHALRLGAEKIATGHYARVRAVGHDTPVRAGGDARLGGIELLKGVDPAKDQSYFLHRLTPAQLAHTLFPVGELKKTEVRRLAEEIGLPNARRKDSTGICFIGERPFREFLSRYLSHESGPMLDPDGREVGRHVGLSFYTIGQRQGLGIGGLRPARRGGDARGGTRGGTHGGTHGGAHRDDDGRPDGGGRGSGEHAPWYVAGKDTARNALLVVQGHDHPWLAADGLAATDASWIAGHAPPPGVYGVKTRYRQADSPARFAPMPDGGPNGAGGFSLAFDADHRQWAVAPGQSAVLYDGEVCLGGGIIASASVRARHAP